MAVQVAVVPVLAAQAERASPATLAATAHPEHAAAAGAEAQAEERVATR